MKRTPKWSFFIVAFLIVVLVYTALFGVYSQYGDRVDTIIRGVDGIRWGIDIRGGVDVTFGPVDDEIEITANQLDGVKSIIEQRLVAKNITDYEAYTDVANRQVIVRFPWASETETPEEAVKEIGQTAVLEFHIGSEKSGKLVLTGNDIAKAEAMQTQDENGNIQHVVSLEMKDSGKKAFAEATKQQAAAEGTISIWLDDQMISNPTVKNEIPNGKGMIDGMPSAQEARELAALITSGALPFDIEAKSLGSISPTMGSNALYAMGIAAVIAMALVVVLMIVIYRMSGFVAAIALCGQMAMTIACISGYFGALDSFTMTLPGIAGMILSIGIGVDCNVITAESVRDELRAGKTIDSAIRSGSKNSFWAIFDGNITVLIVAAVLMGVFGSSNTLFGFLFSWLPVSTTGSVYAFGYTLLIGVITNFIFGVWLSRVMLRSISRLKIFRKAWLYGGDRA
ncbi:MAG: protein translocase subunit SecD [Clostridia bacterium]|nr:protein translocase subunit SecD [Clostridia bacterium]